MSDPVAVPSMTTIPPFPALADRSDGTYNTKAYNFGTHMAGTFNGELTAVADSAYANALAAYNSAFTAGAQADAAIAAVNALPWSAGTYSPGNVRYSPLNGRTYRCYVAVSGSTDPSLDRTKWACASAGPRPYLQVQDQRTSGTGGATSTASTWNTRVVNTTLSNTIPGASVASNQISLEAGEYEMQASGQAFANLHKLALYNVTDSVFVLLGVNASGSLATGVSGVSEVHGKFSISSAKVFEFRHYVSSSGSFGSALSSGQVEVYLDAQFWMVD